MYIAVVILLCVSSVLLWRRRQAISNKNLSSVGKPDKNINVVYEQQGHSIKATGKMDHFIINKDGNYEFLVEFGEITGFRKANEKSDFTRY